MGRPATASNGVVDDLKRRIEAGELPAERPLPSEVALAEEYGVARKTIQRALATLEQANVIEVGKAGRKFPKSSQPIERVVSRTEELAALLSREISAGDPPAGARVASAVALAERFQITRGTAQAVLVELERRGVVVSVKGRGRFVPVGDEPVTTKAAQLAEAMRRSIASGETPRGTAMPGERDLAAEHKVSRGVAGRALKMLEDEGLLQRGPRSERVVAEAAASHSFS